MLDRELLDHEDVHGRDALVDLQICHGEEFLAINRTQRFVTVSLIYQAFDRDGNGLGPAFAGGSLAGSQGGVLSGLAPATPLAGAAADCSGIDRLELDTTVSRAF